MEVRSTEDGMLRAFANLVQQQSNARKIKQKRIYREIGNAIHASRCLTKSEAASVNRIVDKLNDLDPRDEANATMIDSLFKELGKHPIKFVPRKREQRVDHSKTYPYRSTKRGG
jgi:seryl-tRNA synthetase